MKLRHSEPQHARERESVSRKSYSWLKKHERWNLNADQCASRRGGEEQKGGGDMLGECFAALKGATCASTHPYKSHSLLNPPLRPRRCRRNFGRFGHIQPRPPSRLPPPPLRSLPQPEPLLLCLREVRTPAGYTHAPETIDFYSCGVTNNTSPGSHIDLNVLLGVVNWPKRLRQDGLRSVSNLRMGL